MTARPVSRKSENSANLRKAPISSAAARRLCEAAVKRYGSLRKAAAALGLKSHGQLYQIMKGRMRDTAEMKAALRRADRRAKRAWELVRDEGPAPHIDVAALRGAISVVDRQLKLMRELLKQHGLVMLDPQPEITDRFVREVLTESQLLTPSRPNVESADETTNAVTAAGYSVYVVDGV